MNRFTKYVSSQFKNPRGFGGVIISIIQNVLNRAMYNDAATIVSLKHDDRVLDIGYGNGYLLQILYKKQVVDLYGIDISDAAKKMATKKNAGKEIYFVVTDEATIGRIQIAEKQGCHSIDQHRGAVQQRQGFG